MDEQLEEYDTKDNAKEDTEEFLKESLKGSFLEKCREAGYSNLSLFKAALSFSKSCLAEKKRLSGDSYFEHNVRVAQILAENKASPEVTAAALLHGTLKCSSQKELEEKFGHEIAALIGGVEEIKQIKSKNIKLEAEALCKILLATLGDIRVIFIKLADKIDNLRTIAALPENEQQRIAREVMDVYAPLAYSLGLEKIRVALEDLSLQILHPKKYKEIADFLEESKEEREEFINEVIEKIKEISKNKLSILKIKGRSKHIYSIFRKIVQRKVPLHQQFDLSGIRIIVPEIKDCYTLLGLLHENFDPVEGKLKDYIANPKPNGYRSLHTAIKISDRKIVEVQLRTKEMDEFAEEGIAAHWKYKGLKSDQLFQKKISWLRNVLELQKEGHKEFLEAAKIDIFGDKIYCYTPKGDVKELPQGATLLDFAYSVHEDVGNRAVGGKVNGKFVPLRHELALGDVVEVLTNKNQRPRRAWVKFVKSARAKQKIRKSLLRHEKLPALWYRIFKPVAKEDQGILAEAKDFPKALCILAKCCTPLPGDNIIGIATKRRVISVHSIDCRQALKEEQRWISVKWRETFNQKIKFNVRAGERSGLLADLLNTTANAGFEVKEAKAKLIGPGNAECSFVIIPRDLQYLQELIRKVKKVKGVRKVYFE
ncbi:MAG: RelA/SpoT family protein [Nanoarchaeota archaeon]